MKILKELESIDAVADQDDYVEIRIQDRNNGQVLYVDVNGTTILRIGQITQKVEMRLE